MISIDNKDIESIRLLSVSEVCDLPCWIRAHGDWWWLRSPGSYSTDTTYVDCDGFIGFTGRQADNNNGTVRPALKIRNLDSQNLEIGEMVNVLGLFAQYIGRKSVLLCEGIGGYHRFDAKSNDYKTSEIKQLIEEWLEEKKGR